jgi:hypothetical protein
MCDPGKLVGFSLCTMQDNGWVRNCRGLYHRYVLRSQHTPCPILVKHYTRSIYCFLSEYASIQMGDDIDQSRMILLFEVLGTRGNIGQLPAKFRSCLSQEWSVLCPLLSTNMKCVLREDDISEISLVKFRSFLNALRPGRQACHF